MKYFKIYYRRHNELINKSLRQLEEKIDSLKDLGGHVT